MLMRSHGYERFWYTGCNHWYARKEDTELLTASRLFRVRSRQILSSVKQAIWSGWVSRLCFQKWGHSVTAVGGRSMLRTCIAGLLRTTGGERHALSGALLQANDEHRCNRTPKQQGPVC